MEVAIELSTGTETTGTETIGTEIGDLEWPWTA